MRRSSGTARLRLARCSGCWPGVGLLLFAVLSSGCGGGKTLLGRRVGCGQLVTQDGVFLVPASLEVVDCELWDLIVPDGDFRFEAWAGECRLENMSGAPGLQWRCPPGYRPPNETNSEIPVPTGERAIVEPGQVTSARIRFSSSWLNESLLRRGAAKSTRTCVGQPGYCDFVRPSSDEQERVERD